MIDSFERFLELSEQDRRDVLETTARRLGTIATYVEKDWWVCLTLDLLYHDLPDDHPSLLFKGGTSLSKGHGLIDRFSEDIDIVVSREDLGFAGRRDPTSSGTEISRKERDRLFEALAAACAGYLEQRLRDELQRRLDALYANCTVRIDPTDDQSLIVAYPTLFPIELAAYIQPRVKLEAGARSARQPSQDITVVPYLAEELPDWPFAVGDVAAILPERTYLEKLLILHGLHHGNVDEGRVPPDRNLLSRHYYDVAKITATPVGERALSDGTLLSDVREHNQVAFRSGWKKFELAVPGSLRLVPEGTLRDAIEKDYRAMEGMIIGEAPRFDWVLEQIRVAEQTTNGV